MRTYKAYVNIPYREFNHNYQTVFVSFYVKNVMLITHIIGCGEVNFYVRQILPLSPLCSIIPSLKGSLCISMSFRTVEFHQFSM